MSKTKKRKSKKQVIKTPKGHVQLIAEVWDNGEIVDEYIFSTPKKTDRAYQMAKLWLDKGDCYTQVKFVYSNAEIIGIKAK